jgi:two-component system, LytTR family, sensor kinase
MKVKWQQHGIILATLLALILIGCYIGNAFDLTASHAAHLLKRFPQQSATLSHIKVILLPQIGSVVLLYGCYIWINLGIIPLLRRAILNQNGMGLFGKLAVGIFQLAVISFLLGPVVNIVSFYCDPGFFSRGAPYIPLTIGYHPQPLMNLFGGWGISAGIVVLYCLFASIREVFIHNIRRSEYQIIVSNATTFIALIYFVVLAFFAAFDLFSPAVYRFYTAVVPVCLLVLLTNIYALFPRKQSWIGLLLLSSFIYTVFFSRFLGEHWSFMYVLGIWLLQLAVISPISWLEYRRQKEKILQIKGMEAALGHSEADLAFLRSQINPHFLFNALNTLYGTALIDGSKTTASGIQQLGDMMRFMLEENHQKFISVGKEVAYLNNYISLQKLRTQLSADIVIEEHINVTDDDRQIAPMLMIPFIENAFKHGISLETPSYIRVTLNDISGGLMLKVSNSVHPKAPNDPENDRSGIGLANVTKRLNLLYPGKHKLTITENTKEFIVKLEIQLT